LLVAFGEDRDRYANAAEIQRYSEVAPVVERSGKMLDSLAVRLPHIPPSDLCRVSWGNRTEIILG
jgi:hypothetical protein